LSFSRNSSAIFGAYRPDAHHIADGTRIAATISVALTVLNILIRGNSGGNTTARWLLVGVWKWPLQQG
jgi:hypothetical protein